MIKPITDAENQTVPKDSPNDVARPAGYEHPLVAPTKERVDFETLLANLSATFVNVPAAEVDSQIESGLKQIVEFLDIDRSGFGEVTADGMVITHSYELPGVPPSPRVILEAQFPAYARKVQRGEVFRLPEDLPPEASREREFCEKTGLRSNLTIPLKVTGAVVGGIGFASFRSACDWPDELIQRLRLVGDIFTNALARKRADEALQRATEQARVLREELAHVTRQELINHLATSVAHEVNQPLCAIASNAQTALELLEMGDIEEVKNALQDIWNDARRGSDVIGRIRGMVKKQESTRTKMCLGSIVEELQPLLSREAHAKGVALQLDRDPNELSVLCDRVHLQQVVVNLFLNAIEAVNDRSEGPPAVQIRAWRESLNWAHVSVADTGVGLPKDDFEKVFTPYFTTKKSGLGMGLNISRSIIEAHGGSLWATAGAECGTTFEFRIPARSSHDA